MAIETHIRMLWAKHSFMLKSMVDLARTYWEQGLRKQAEELEAQVKEFCHRVLGTEHSDTLKSMANLAQGNGRRGQWKEAEELQVQVNETTQGARS